MMKRYLKNDVLKDRAKYYLDGHYGTMILGFFFFITLLMCFSIMLTSAELAVQDTFGKTGAAMTLFRWLGNFATQLLVAILQFGFAYACLKLVCRQRLLYTDLFCGFQGESFLPIAVITFVRLVINSVCFALSDYLSRGFNFSLTDELDLLQLLYILLALLGGYVIYIPISLALDLSFYLVLDFPEKNSFEVLRDSFKIIRGHRKRFLYLQLSFFPMYLLMCLSLGIGFLWLFPYYQMSVTLFYLDLMHPSEG